MLKLLKYSQNIIFGNATNSNSVFSTIRPKHVIHQLTVDFIETVHMTQFKAHA